MPLHYDDDFAQDEPSFDLGWSIDPEGAAGDTLENMVVTINGMQDQVDGGAKSEIAKVQTAINLLQNRLRNGLQERIDVPSASLIELQERIAVDSAGRMADIGERFNGFASQIAGDDDAFQQCQERCRQTFLDCADDPDNQDLHSQLVCESLLWECVQMCRVGHDPETDPPIGPPPTAQLYGDWPPTSPPGGGPIPEPGDPGWPEHIPFPPGTTPIPQPPTNTGGMPPDLTGGGTLVPSDFEIDPGGFTSDKRACLLPDMSGIDVVQVGGTNFYVNDGRIPFPPPTTSDGIGVGNWEVLPYDASNLPRDKDLWISVLEPCEQGEPGCTRGRYGQWEVAKVYKGKCQPVLLPHEPVPPGVAPEPGGVCCPPPSYSCRLYFDCKSYEVYGLLVAEGSEALPRHTDDIQIGSSGITEEQFRGMVNACRGFDPDSEPGEPDPRPEGVDNVSFCLSLTAGPVLQHIAHDPATLCNMLGFGEDADGNLTDPDWLDHLSFPAEPIIRAIFKPLKAICQFLNDNIEAYLTLVDCFGPGMFAIIGTRIVLSIVSLITGRALSNWDLALEQQQNFKCPVSVPHAQDAIVAYLGKTIDEETAKCWVQANNFNWADYQHVMRASRSKLGVNELIQLRLRNEIDDATLDERIRMLGFMDAGEPDEFLELSKWVPGPQDLIRWMVRDVEDMNVVNAFDLDDDFTAKFGGQVEKYAEWQNIDKQDMLRYWRAHWTIPGPHQLYEMYHRLRYADIPPNERVTRDSIKLALKQQDIAPYWVDRLLAVSFRPLTRVDVRRAYRIGSINRPQVERAYKELGYSDANAAILGDFAEQLVKNTWIKSPLIGRYVKGELNAGELNNLAIQEGALPQLVPDMISRGDALRNAETRGKCLASLRKRYLEAEFTNAQALQEVTLIGVDAGVAATIVDGWECELSAQGKEAPASTLCGWWQDGIIDTAQFHQRLRNLGYDYDTALHFQAQCEIKYNRKVATEERKRIKQIEAENKRIAKEMEKQARAVDKQRKQREAAADKMNKTRQRREDVLVESAKRLANRLDDDIVMTMREVKATNASMKSLMTWPEAIIVQSIAQASQVKELANLAEFQPMVLGILNERPVDQLSGNGNGNGQG